MSASKSQKLGEYADDNDSSSEVLEYTAEHAIFESNPAEGDEPTPKQFDEELTPGKETKFGFVMSNSQILCIAETLLCTAFLAFASK